MDIKLLQKMLSDLQYEHGKLALLLRRHADTVRMGDGVLEGQVRNEIHAQLDIILDYQTQITKGKT